MAFPVGWGRKCKITIPDTQIQGSNTDFPALFTKDNFPTEMMDGGANSALGGGGDVRFSEDGAGSARLACEIVDFVTGSAPSAKIHVKLPTLNTGADRDIWVWYKKAGETQPAVTDPYGRNAVWADEELALIITSTSPVDHSGNHTITKVGSPSLVTDGPGGISGLSFDGTLAEYLRTGITTALTNYSLRIICRGHSVPGTGPTGASGPASGDGNMAIGWHHSNSLFRHVYAKIASLWRTAALSSRSANVIYHLCSTYDGSNLNAYQDGGLINTTLAAGTPGTIGNLTIAAHSVALTQRWDGDVFTVLLRSGALSDDWIATEYNNQSDPASFASAGVPQAVGGGASLTVQSFTSGHLTDNVTLLQTQSLLVDDGVQSQGVGSPALTQGQTLSISEIFHNIDSDVSTLAQTYILTVGHAGHGLISDSMTLGMGNSLLIAVGTHGIFSDENILQQIQALTLHNSSHGLTSDEGGIFDPTAFSPNPERLCRAKAESRNISLCADYRSNQPTNH